MQYLKVSIGIFAALAASRFIPHPPNFTSLIALSFYVPLFLGLRFIPIVILSFAVTDLVIGYHSGTHWTWGSVLVIGVCSQFFTKNTYMRITGVISSAFIFFIVTNFGVWTSGMYGYTLEGFYNCYALAIPFFGYSIVSTLIFSSIIETFYKLYKTKLVNQ